MDYYDTCRNCAIETAIDTDVTVDGRNDIVFKETPSNQDYQSGQLNLINPVPQVDILSLTSFFLLKIKWKHVVGAQ